MWWDSFKADMVTREDGYQGRLMGHQGRLVGHQGRWVPGQTDGSPGQTGGSPGQTDGSPGQTSTVGTYWKCHNQRCPDCRGIIYNCIVLGGNRLRCPDNRMRCPDFRSKNTSGVNVISRSVRVCSPILGDSRMQPIEMYTLCRAHCSTKITHKLRSWEVALYRGSVRNSLVGGAAGEILSYDVGNSGVVGRPGRFGDWGWGCWGGSAWIIESQWRVELLNFIMH